MFFKKIYFLSSLQITNITQVSTSLLGKVSKNLDSFISKMETVSLTVNVLLIKLLLIKYNKVCITPDAVYIKTSVLLTFQELKWYSALAAHLGLNRINQSSD